VVKFGVVLQTEFMLQKKQMTFTPNKEV